MSVTIVATLFPADGQRAEVIAALEEAIVAVHADDEGCELYALQEGEDRVVMIEKWASPGAIKAHSQSPGLLALVARLEGKLAGPMDVQTLTPHPAEPSSKGRSSYFPRKKSGG